MESIDKIYTDLTNVDLGTQQLLWDERGKGYYGEFCVFRELYFSIIGNCKFLMNLQIPVQGNKTTEIDLVMIHETGIYVFEIKHYKGTIYGDESGRIWTQYFRTTANNTFDNPVNQNKYHISALSKLYPDLPIFSVIVFSNPDCDLRHNTLITPLKSLVSSLRSNYFSNLPAQLSIEKINDIFLNLQNFSPLKQKNIVVNENVVPLYDYLSIIKNDFQEQSQQLTQSHHSLQKEYRSKRIKHLLSSIAISACVIIASILMCNAYLNHEKELMNEHIADANSQVTAAINELETMQNYFKKVDPVKDSYSEWVSKYIKILDVELSLSTQSSSTALFTCKVSNSSNTYSIQFTEETAYIIHLKNGNVYEYPMFGERLKYNYNSQRIASKKSGNLVVLEILNLDKIDDIEYIKLNNITILGKDGEIIKENNELELFSSTSN